MQAQNQIEKALFTQSEMSQKLGICRHTFAKWQKLGIVNPVIKIGNVVRYHFDETMNEIKEVSNHV